MAIVGGGFSGAMVAVHIARLAPGPVAVDVFEPLPFLGGGVAYSATDPAHRINVPAARMTVFSEDPTHFDRWLRAQDWLQDDPDQIWRDGTAFPQRRVFGRYVAGLVAEARAAFPHVKITHHMTSVIDIAAHGQGYALRTEAGQLAEADVVVLAVSHPPPAVPALLRPVLAAGAPVIANPWLAGALDAIEPGASVIIIGTGLTSADAIATLARRKHLGPILAVSRRGLMSRGHAFGDIAKRNHFATAPRPITALGLCRTVRDSLAQAAAEGAPWQAVFDDVRTNARRLWTALPVAEQRRVVRHLRPFWDVHRFRVAPQVEAAIARLRAAGQFRSMAASILGAEMAGGRVAVRLRPRHAAMAACITHLADAVIVTTGPAHGGAVRSNPALAALARQGLVRADTVGLGLEVDAENHPLGTDGAARPDLFVAGPLARGRVGELMGLPQVSDHAETVAGAVAALLQITQRKAEALLPFNQRRA